MSLSRLLIILLLSAPTIASSCKSNSNKFRSSDESQKYFPKPVSYVNDFIHLYTDSQRIVLDSLIDAFEKKTTMEIALVTFDPKMAAQSSIDSFTYHIGNAWGVGKKDKNNGIVIGICNVCRKIWIENGKGTVKILSNAETKSIIDNSFIPYFKNAEFYAGTLNGLKDLVALLEERLKTDLK